MKHILFLILLCMSLRAETKSITIDNKVVITFDTDDITRVVPANGDAIISYVSNKNVLLKLDPILNADTIKAGLALGNIKQVFTQKTIITLSINNKDVDIILDIPLVDVIKQLSLSASASYNTRISTSGIAKK